MIASFPADYSLTGPYEDQWSIVGMSVALLGPLAINACSLLARGRVHTDAVQIIAIGLGFGLVVGLLAGLFCGMVAAVLARSARPDVYRGST